MEENRITEEDEITRWKEVLRRFYKDYEISNSEDRFFEIEMTGDMICRVCGEEMFSCQCDEILKSDEI